LGAVDTHHKPSDSIAPKGADSRAEHATGHKLLADATPASADQAHAAKTRPDTAKLHDVKIDMSSPTAGDAYPKPEIKAPPDSNTPIEQKDKDGNSVYSRTPDGNGGFSDLRTAPDGVMTATEQNANGDYMKQIIDPNKNSVTIMTHKQDGKGGFTDTTVNPDGTKSVQTRTMDGNGGYTETTKANGTDVTKTYDSNGKEVQNKPPAQAQTQPAQPIDAANANPNRPKPPNDAIGEGANQADSVGGQLFDAVKTPKTATNSADVLKEGAKDVKALADAMKDSASGAKALQLGGVVAENLAKGMGNISPVVTGLQIAGVGIQAFEGDYSGALKNGARMVFTKGAAATAAALATESTPVGMAAAGFAANTAAGKLWDGIADGSINRQSTLDALAWAGDKFIHMADSPNFSD
jgi:hypothetical protein